MKRCDRPVYAFCKVTGGVDDEVGIVCKGGAGRRSVYYKSDGKRVRL